MSDPIGISEHVCSFNFVQDIICVSNVCGAHIACESIDGLL